MYNDEANFKKLGSSFTFGSDDDAEDQENDGFVGVDDNPKLVDHEWKNIFSLIPDVPETPLYQPKPIISNQYNSDTEFYVGKFFPTREKLDVAIRLNVYKVTSFW